MARRQRCIRVPTPTVHRVARPATIGACGPNRYHIGHCTIRPSQHNRCLRLCQTQALCLDHDETMRSDNIRRVNCDFDSARLADEGPTTDTNARGPTIVQFDPALAWGDLADHDHHGTRLSFCQGRGLQRSTGGYSRRTRSHCPRTLRRTPPRRLGSSAACASRHGGPARHRRSGWRAPGAPHRCAEQGTRPSCCRRSRRPLYGIRD